MQLRKVLNIYWPDKISNEEIYRRTEVKRWSWVVKKKRLMWLGHLLRLDKETPARQALVEYTKPVKRKIGRPRLTWVNQVYQDLKSSNIDDVIFGNECDMIIGLEEICKDRLKWKNIIKSIMLIY